MEGGAEGDNCVEGGTVSQPASARPAENVGDGGREGWRVKFVMRHGVVVVGGMEKKYRRKRAAVTVTESCSGRRWQRRVAAAGETPARV